MIRRRAIAFALAAGLLGAIGMALPSGAAPATAPADTSFTPTPLPSSGETCILQQVGAQVNTGDVADLDIWQIAEGGSTENDNSYNPFNTKRAVDGNGNPLPAVLTPDGFPAFTTWVAGCTATAQTILQPNMAPIVTALTAPDPPTPADFLAIVDLTPWCAPSDGQPCYESLITDGTAGPTPPKSQAVALVSDSTKALSSYAQDIAGVAAGEGTLNAADDQLQADDAAVSVARWNVQKALDQLRAMAVSDYTSDNSLDRVSNLAQFENPTTAEQLQQYYQGIDAAAQVGRYRDAQDALSAAQSQQVAATDQVSRADAALGAAQSTEDDDLAHLAVDLAALQAAGVCTSVPPLGAVPAQAMPAVGALAICATALAD